MARYAIGDIQGCYKQFIQLVNKINFNPSKDVLYLVGDLVNRGPKSLEVLKWIYQHQNSIINVLGNHDFYLLARYYGVAKPDGDDTLSALLRDKNIDKYIDWLRCSPLIFHDNDYILAHAGIYPKMNFNDLIHCCHAISNSLSASQCRRFLEDMFSNKPNNWDENYSLINKSRFVINSLTRMRFLNKDSYGLDFKYKGDIAQAPENLTPWFDVELDSSIKKHIVFGHWAALGFKQTLNFSAIDTGCVWGRKLTALNLENKEIIQVSYDE